MTDRRGVEFVCRLDGRGGGVFGGVELIDAPLPEGGLLWIHLDHRASKARRWIREESGLDALASAALLAEETRPRSTVRGGGLLVDLRGVNLNPGSRPDDMVALRIFLEEGRILSSKHRRLMAVSDLRAALESGNGPRDAGEFLVDIGDHLLKRMGVAFEDLDARLDAIEERIEEHAGSQLRGELANLRGQIVALRRYLAPQRDALLQLLTAKVPWLDDLHREHLREIANRTTRRVEDLEEARDRAGIAHEELSARMAEHMNRTMYVLAIVTTIFLPLGLITGLLGINVGGMPGEHDPAAFWIVCVGLVGLAGFQWWLFKRMKWL